MLLYVLYSTVVPGRWQLYEECCSGRPKDGFLCALLLLLLLKGACVGTGATIITGNPSEPLFQRVGRVVVKCSVLTLLSIYPSIYLFLYLFIYSWVLLPSTSCSRRLALTHAPPLTVRYSAPPPSLIGSLYLQHQSHQMQQMQQIAQETALHIPP